MDCTNLSEKNVLYVVGSVAQALEHDLAIVSFSRKLTWKLFSHVKPLLLNWDGKSFPGVKNTINIHSYFRFNDISWTRNATRSNKNWKQSAACLEAINSWNVGKFVK